MIKLPKEVVVEFAKELEVLVEERENSLTKDEIQEIKNQNKSYENKVNEIEKKIKGLEKEVTKFKNLIKSLPKEAEQSIDNRIQELIDMLVLSGYYVKVVKPDGEYLEETKIYGDLETKDEILVEEVEPIVEEVEPAEVEPAEVEEEVVKEEDHE